MPAKGKTPAPALVVGDSCGGCTFWRVFEMTPGVGRCKRFPPTPMVAAGCEQPTSRATDWCGEFETKAAEAARPVGFAPPAPEQEKAA